MGARPRRWLKLHATLRATLAAAIGTELGALMWLRRQEQRLIDCYVALEGSTALTPQERLRLRRELVPAAFERFGRVDQLDHAARGAGRVRVAGIDRVLRLRRRPARRADGRRRREAERERERRRARAERDGVDGEQLPQLLLRARRDRLDAELTAEREEARRASRMRSGAGLARIDANEIAQHLGERALRLGALQRSARARARPRPS